MRTPTKPITPSPRDNSYFIIVMQLLSSGRRSGAKISAENEHRSTMTTLSLASNDEGIYCVIIDEDLTATPPTREKRRYHFIARDALTDEEWTLANEVLAPKPHNLTCLKQPMAFELQYSYIPTGERKR